MRKLALVLIVFTLGFCTDKTTIRQRAEKITRVEMQSVVEFLAHDLLEGRAPGTRGGYLAENYVKSLYNMVKIYRKKSMVYILRTGILLALIRHPGSYKLIQDRIFLNKIRPGL